MKRLSTIILLGVFVATIVFGVSSFRAFATTTTKFIESGTDATQDLSFYSVTSGSVSSDTAQSHTGPRAIKTATTGTAATASFNANAIAADTGRRVSFWWRFDALPAANEAFSFGPLNAGGTRIGNFALQTDGTIKNQPPGATPVAGTTVLSANTWYRISYAYYVTNSTTFAFKLWINGNLESTANAGTLTTTGSTNFQWRINVLAGNNKNMWWDDIYIDDGANSGSQTDTGNILVTAKRPNANGTTNGFSTQIGAGGSGYGTGHSPQVNEQPLSTTNGWSMVGAGSAITEEYNIENASTGDVDITGKTIVDYVGWVYAKSLSNETASIIVNNATSNIALTNANTMFTQAAGSSTYPAGSGTDIGLITTTALTTVSLYEAGIVVAYTPGGGSSSGYQSIPSVNVKIIQTKVTIINGKLIIY